RDGALAWACAHARNIERTEVSLLIEQEAVINAASVEVISRDRPHGVVAFRECALARTCARGWNIECAVCTILKPREAVKHAIRVDEDSFDVPVRSDAHAECAVTVTRVVRARGIDLSERAV